jgi:ABC-type transport system involved in multi-copper enzyme maturation permease subunit
MVPKGRGEAMQAVRTLLRLVRVEAYKFWQKPVTIVVLVMMFIGPIIMEILLASFSIRDATFPRIAQFMFAPDTLLIIALMTVVLSVLALGVDYELGTVPVILSRGVERYQFILSKIIPTVLSAWLNGIVFIAAGMVSIAIVHIKSDSAPFFAAAGEDILWRAMGASMVVGLVNFVLSGAVMIGLVLGRNSWMGMLTGLGYFIADFFVGGIGSGSVFGVKDAYRYTFTYHALSIFERFFPSDPYLSIPRAWVGAGFDDPWHALFILLLFGVTLTAASILIFHRQDLMAKT